MNKMKTPEKSGNYIVLIRSGHIFSVTYSKKYDLWNSDDRHKTRESASKYALESVVGWLDEDKFIEFIKEKEQCDKMIIKMKNPDKSGIYVVITRGGNIEDMLYSKKHNLWNARDSDTREGALMSSFSNIIAWIEKDEVIGLIKENGTVSR